MAKAVPISKKFGSHLQLATIAASTRLFKLIPVSNKSVRRANKELVIETVKRGFVFAPNIIGNYSDEELLQIIGHIGLTPEQLNNAFHKSWQKIKTAPLQQLYLEQIMHYMTTYGFEELGVYDEDSIYIPAEQLNIPGVEKENLKLVIIKGATKEELKMRTLSLLNVGIALKDDIIADVVEIINFAGIDKKELAIIKNNEVKTILYDKLDITPDDPLEFLRLAVYVTTKETLLIKNKKLIDKIKDGDKKQANILFTKCYKYPEKLASIFYRFKPIFLAFKEHTDTNAVINKIRKLARTYHQPMPENYLDHVTDKIKHGKLNVIEFNKYLKAATVFKKIKLAYALDYRTKSSESIVYKIRNGKGYATEFEFNKPAMAKKALKIVLDSIAGGMKVKGKKIYIPANIEYALPATAKQFVGNFPAGTSIAVNKDMIFGVHWNNVGHQRIDLDLSLIDSAGEKFGWNSLYRNDDRTILFSGDMTDASGPNGASELFYIAKQKAENYLVYMNNFNYGDKLAVPFQIVIAKEMAKDLKQGYVINPNNMVAQVETKVDLSQKILGLINITAAGSKFYFVETGVGNSNVASNGAQADQTREYLFKYYTDTITLNEVLKAAGAKIVADKDKCDIDLSPEALTKDSIINLLK